MNLLKIWKQGGDETIITMKCQCLAIDVVSFIPALFPYLISSSLHVNNFYRKFFITSLHGFLGSPSKIKLNVLQ